MCMYINFVSLGRKFMYYIGTMYIKYFSKMVTLSFNSTNFTFLKIHEIFCKNVGDTCSCRISLFS